MKFDQRHDNKIWTGLVILWQSVFRCNQVKRSNKAWLLRVIEFLIYIPRYPLCVDMVCHIYNSYSLYSMILLINEFSFMLVIYKFWAHDDYSGPLYIKSNNHSKNLISNIKSFQYLVKSFSRIIILIIHNAFVRN